MVKLEETLWLPLLRSNQWILVAPEAYKLTVVCNELAEDLIL